MPCITVLLNCPRDSASLKSQEDCSKDNLVLRVYHLQGGGKMTDTGNEVAPKNGAAWHRFT